jgi:acyl-coenzyme A synthetase/AMP-(fatty) acid ligase
VVTPAIFAHARRTPDHAALVHDGVALSFRQFAGRIARARRHLAAQEIGGGIAAVPIVNIRDAWIHGLALRSLGITTIVVRAPADITALELPGLRAVVSTAAEHDEGLVAASARAGWRYIRMPDTGDGDAALADPDVAPGGHILLTSGTTGIHKKVLIPAHGLPELVAFRRRVFALTAQSVVSTFNFGGWTSVGYQVAVATWEAGGCVVMEQGADAGLSFRYPGLTHAFTTPQVLAALLAAPPEAPRRDGGLSLFVTGGPLAPSVAQAVKARLTPRLHTHIGSTEASAFTLTAIETDEDLRWHRILPSRVVEVVDEAGRRVPPGRLGEVRVRTLGDVAGYLDDAEATRTFFRDGYFYPGDLGLTDAEGRLALHGRVTDVVNVLGNKLAAGPIEAALQSILGVSGACVLSLPGASGEEIVHVVLETPRPVAEADMASALAKALPGRYHAHIHYVASLPRNALGKLERAALRQRFDRVD